MVNRVWSIRSLADIINQTIRTDKDFFVGISGETGSGKSTLAIWLAKRISKDFKIKNNIVYSREDLINAINTFPKFSVIICDEAITALFKRDFMQKAQKDMLRLFDICRHRNLVVILCIPVFWSLDKHVLESKVKLRLHIDKTGFAIMFKPTNHPHSPDPWSRQHNLKVAPDWDNSPNARRMVGWIGWLKFPDLRPKWKEVYLKWQQKKKEEIAQMSDAEVKKKEKDIKRFVDNIRAFQMHELMHYKILKLSQLKEYCILTNTKYTALQKNIQKIREALRDKTEVKPGEVEGGISTKGGVITFKKLINPLEHSTNKIVI